MPKSTMNLAAIAEAFADGTLGTFETLSALRQLDRNKEVFRTLLEQASANPGTNWDATREAAASILASLRPEEEATTGTAAEVTRTLLDTFGHNNFTSVVVNSYQFPVLLDWLRYRGSWFAIESEPFRSYRVVVRIEHKEALDNFVTNVLDNFFV